jgi:hypothetical protein
LQDKDKFSRDFYAISPVELRFVFKGYVLKMVKPLIGTKEAGIYRNAAYYLGDWKQKLDVISSTIGPYFMSATCNQAKDAPHGIAAITVDATLMTGNKLSAKAAELLCEARTHVPYITSTTLGSLLHSL